MPNRTTIPAGKYYLGDPCYLFTTKRWQEVIKETDYFDKPFALNKTCAAVAFATGGDGEFDDQNGFSYPVDSGMIGVVSESLVSTSAAAKSLKMGITRLVEFSGPADCFSTVKTLHFGNIDINLEPEDDEEDGYCPHCGRGN